jgi:hypothetical protein
MYVRYDTPKSFFRDAVSDKRGFARMEQSRDVRKLDIPTVYENPRRDALEVKKRLDEELKRELDSRQKSVSGEFRFTTSPRLSTAAGTPDRRMPVSRMNSNASDSSEKGRGASRRSSKGDKVDITDEPFANFADIETSTWPSPQTTRSFDNNPFRMQELSGDDSLLKSLSFASESEIESLVRILVSERPSLRSIIHSALSQ